LGEYIYRVRGPLWERKIRKIKKTINTIYTPAKNADRNVGTKKEHSDENNILCFSTNADQLKNKLNEFERRIEKLKPNIIAINKVKPKKSKMQCNNPRFVKI